MAVFLQDLDQRFPIVDENGKPTDYFLRLLRGQTGDLADGLTDADSAIVALQSDVATLEGRNIDTGFGLSGGGDLSADRTIALGNPALTDPNADRGVFWDDSAGRLDWLTYGSGLTLSGTTLTASGGGGGSGVFGQNNIGAASTSAYAGKGATVVPTYAMEITKIRQSINCANVAHSYTAYILELNGSNVVQAVTGTSSAVVPGVVSTAFQSFDFASPVALTAKTRYALMVYLTNATGTTSSGANAGTGLISGFPDELTSTFGRHAASAPAVGNTIETGGNQFHMGLVFSLS